MKKTSRIANGSHGSRESQNGEPSPVLPYPARLSPEQVATLTPPASVAPAPERMASSLRETAQMLGISYPTAHRLLQRGLLRSSSALRTKLISRAEIERFLKDTSK